jgi:hypothetical protein
MGKPITIANTYFNITCMYGRFEIQQMELFQSDFNFFIKAPIWLNIHQHYRGNCTIMISYNAMPSRLMELYKLGAVREYASLDIKKHKLVT